MQLNIGMKIRELRHRNGRTQEALAEALGVTSQAVSRWESGGSYPDMEMMPAIANYFHVSIDALFGYYDDREDKIKTILDRASSLIDHQGFVLMQGDVPNEVSECVEMLREASEEFPNEPKILLKLGKAHYMMGWYRYGCKIRSESDPAYLEEDTEYNSQNIHWQEALRVYEKVLKLNPMDKDREDAIFSLLKLYRFLGEFEKAKTLAKKQASLSVCRENLMPKTAFGEEAKRYEGEQIIALLSSLSMAIENAVSGNQAVYSSEYGREMLLSVLKLFEMVFYDGNFGAWHFHIGHDYMTMAYYEAKYGDLEKALSYFDKGFDHYAAYNRLQENQNEADERHYTAPLISKVKVAKKRIPVQKDFWEKKMNTFPQNLCGEIRKNEKYAECFDE